MSTSSEAKNLEAIYKAIDHHNATCEYPAVAVAMNPFEVERLGWDSIRGLPIRSDPAVGTGAFRIVCGGDEIDESETVEAVAEEAVPVEPQAVPIER
jgi:hypothetical protein